MRNLMSFFRDKRIWRYESELMRDGNYVRRLVALVVNCAFSFPVKRAFEYDLWDGFSRVLFTLDLSVFLGRWFTVSIRIRRPSYMDETHEDAYLVDYLKEEKERYGYTL